MRVPMLLVVGLWAIGCSSPGPKVVGEEYTGPKLTTESSGPRHTLILTAPSAGWSLALDRTNRLFDETEVFISIIRPDPSYMHAQVLTTHRLDSSVDSGTQIRLFARTQDFGRRDAKRPYQPVKPTSVSGPKPGSP